MTHNLMGCFSTSNSKAEKQCAARATSAMRLDKPLATRDSFSLLSNKPVLLPNPDQLLDRPHENDDEHWTMTIKAPVVTRIRVEKPFVTRAAFSGPLLSSTTTHDEPRQLHPRLQFSNAEFVSCSDVESGARNRRMLRRAASFGGRPQPLPRPVADVPQISKQVKVYNLPLAHDAPRDGVAPMAPRLQASATKVFKLEAGNAPRARRGPRVTGVTGEGLPLPPPSLATKWQQPCLAAFEFRQLVLATDDFSAAQCVVKSAAGDVFLARIKDSNGAVPFRAATVDVAVLRLPENFQQDASEWTSEVQLLSQISHRNVCVLKGYCVGSSLSPSSRRRQERLLVFSQPANGSLYDHLFGGRCFLDWTTRVNIALGTARGLLYIQDCVPLQIVFKEVNASTVLLERDYEPKLAGYGLSVAVVHHRSSSFATSTIRSQSQAKLNVRSFGVLLLELLSGKNSRDARYLGDDANFVHWGQRQLMKQEEEEESRLVEIVDPRMNGGCPTKGATELLRLGLRCASQREPSWLAIVAALQSIKTRHCRGKHEESNKTLVRQSHRSLRRTASAPALDASSSKNEDVGMVLQRLANPQRRPTNYGSNGALGFGVF